MEPVARAAEELVLAEVLLQRLEHGRARLEAMNRHVPLRALRGRRGERPDVRAHVEDDVAPSHARASLEVDIPLFAPPMAGDPLRESDSRQSPLLQGRFRGSNFSCNDRR